ncbi:MAG: hypothetical protein HYV07_14535 [Deltaproteobacteria bacterium]|nr:hypothetical protein [Deltaproteobacteria bacterium]
MRTNFAAMGMTLLLLSQASVADAQTSDGRIYGFATNTNRDIYQIDVNGVAPTFTKISKNALGWFSNAATRDPRDSFVYFTENTTNARLGRFDPAQSTINGGTKDCYVTPLQCMSTVGTGAGNPSLSGRLGMRQFAFAPDPRIVGVAQNISDGTGIRPLYIVNPGTGVATYYGRLTVGGVSLNAGPGGDQDFNPLDIDCTGTPANVLIPAGSLFVIPAVSNPNVYVVPATEFDDCDGGGDCDLETVVVTNPITGFGSGQVQGMGFDLNTNVSINSGRLRLWTAWSGATPNPIPVAALDVCTAAVVSGSYFASPPAQFGDLTSVIQPGGIGFTGVGCRCVAQRNDAALALVLLPALLVIRRRRG